jgi:hypothetical protein
MDRKEPSNRIKKACKWICLKKIENLILFIPRFSIGLEPYCQLAY